jgi:YidC/Oxa1 family membrane protein insertase
MDQKRLLAAIALSIGILLLFELWNRPAREAQLRQQQEASQQAAAPRPSAPEVPVPPGPLGAVTPPTGERSPAIGAPARGEAARLPIETPRLSGTLNLRGARLDDLVLKDYRETVNPGSPLVRLLAPRDAPAGYFAQWGWTAADGRTRVPDAETDWTASGGPLGPGRPVTLSWDNGQGQAFQVVLSVDENYMFTAEQRVTNAAAEAVQVLPWARIRRERTPETAGFFILHEGFTGVLDGRLREVTYSDAKSEAAQRRGGVAMEQETGAGWLGITDKYWLTALAVVDPALRYRGTYRHVPEGGTDRWQADLAPLGAQEVSGGGGQAALATRLFAGAKEVHLLDRYRDRLGIPDFDKAIDFGWFYFLTKPFFYALDWLFRIFGNFGLAILAFTLALKIAFFPLANKAYKSMSRMKILGPKMQEIRERYKDDPAKAQAEMMAMYRSEKINPASGCLPILIQIPVFFALYKVLFVTIEMRHAPFYGWIRDLSAPDPTNLFNLFGLLPFDPAVWSAGYLHMPAWAIVMGITMYLQFKLNPTPPDPIQAKIFAWMPLIFTFMLAGFPAGLVIYWTWNNLLSIAQQWWIMRHDRRAAQVGKAGGGGGGTAPPAIPPPAERPKKRKEPVG